MSAAKGYSLWLVPSVQSDLNQELTHLIANIANEYQTPNFAPHVTIIGGVIGEESELCNKTQQLADLLDPMFLALEEIDSNGTYFQILFSKIRQTDRIMSANVLAQQIFTGNAAGEYFPHLSLAYGDFSPELVEVLKKGLTTRTMIPGTTLLVQELELWRTEGLVKDWSKVATFQLQT